MCTYKVTFVLKRPTTDERHSCNDFPKTLFWNVNVREVGFLITTL